MVRTVPLGIDNLTTYKGQLQFLRRVGVFHDKLTKCLPNAMANSIFGNLIGIIVREIELVFGVRIQPMTLLKPEGLGYRRNQKRSK